MLYAVLCFKFVTPLCNNDKQIICTNIFLASSYEQCSFVLLKRWIENKVVSFFRGKAAHNGLFNIFAIRAVKLIVDTDNTHISS